MLRHLFDDEANCLRRKVAAIYVGLAAANIGAWAFALDLFGRRPLLLGTALLAYVFGLRHAVDADHIAAIDNVVRRLMQRRKHPVSTGLFFSLGHSTVVILAVLGISLLSVALKGRFAAYRDLGSVVGTGVSATFLIGIAVANLFVLRAVWRHFQAVKRGRALNEDDLDMLLSGRGLLSRIFRPLFGAIDRSSRMYPLGFLFGLGFDTATEIGLLGIAAAQAASGLSLAAPLAFAALFTAGMALVDTTDSVLMVGAYGWAFVNPVRKLWYNLTITAVSVLIALLIGGLEVLGLVADRLALHGAFWRAIGELNASLTGFGFAVIGIFIASWAVSTLIYRWKRYDEL